MIDRAKELGSAAGAYVGGLVITAAWPVIAAIAVLFLLFWVSDYIPLSKHSDVGRFAVVSDGAGDFLRMDTQTGETWFKSRGGVEWVVVPDSVQIPNRTLKDYGAEVLRKAKDENRRPVASPSR